MRPPPLYRLLLWLALRGADSEYVIGDLEEGYADELRTRGKRSADRWYRAHAVSSICACARRLGEMTMAGWWRDLRFGLRGLVRAPGYTTMVLLTLGVGLGGAIVVIALAQGVLRPLPFDNAERLVAVWETRNGAQRSVAPANYLDWRRTTGAFTELAAHDVRTVSLTVDGLAARGRIAYVSGNFFVALGVDAARGRAFDPGLDTSFGAREAVLSHRRWTDAFGADPAVVGRTFQVDEVTYEVVGVTAPGFGFPDPTVEAWLRSRTEAPEINGFRGDLPSLRDSWYFEVFGRLTDGVSFEGARAEMATIADGIAEAHLETNETSGVMLVPLVEQSVARFRSTLVVLALAVALLLIAALVNGAHLMLVRSESRRGEMSLRAALGAGASILGRQAALEGALTGTGGALVGLIFARLATHGGALGPLPGGSDVGVRPSTLILGLIIGVGAGALVGTATHLHARDSARRQGVTATRTSLRGLAQRGLLATQVAAAIALLASAGLIARSLQRLADVDLGFAAEDVVTMSVAVPDARTRSYDERLASYDQLVTDVAGMPDVEQVAYGSNSPLAVGMRAGLFVVDTELEGDPPDAGWQPVTPGYFRTLGIPVLRGRAFDATDRAGTPDVGIVNEALVRSAFSGQDPMGSRVTIGLDGHDRPITIVGVVADTRTGGPARPAAGVLYRPIAQTPGYPATTAFVAVRSRTADGELLARVRAAIRATAPGLPVYGEALGAELARPFQAAQASLLRVLTAFSVAALLLGAVGVYGVATYSVRQRRREIGIRMALGARGGDVVGHVVRTNLARAALGVPIGIAGTILLGRSLSSVLFAVRPTDPLTLGAVSGLVMLVATVALAIPAWGAARTDPATATRSD